MPKKKKLKIKVKLVHPQAKMPKFGHVGDACADVYSVVDVVIQPQEFKPIDTGLQVEIPYGYEMQARPKSGFAMAAGISLVQGVGTIDTQYRGNLIMLVINHGTEPFHVEAGMKIAQVGIRKIPDVEYIKVAELSDTERGEGGFGSTGKY